MSRVNGVDSTDPESYTRGEIAARRQIYDIERYLKRFVPGFADARMKCVAPFMGIRESRVIVGRYILTADDILACRRFDDAVAVASYPVDIHHAVGGDCTLYWCDDCYDIPYRSLVPAAVGRSAGGRTLRVAQPRGYGLGTRDVDMYGYGRSRRPCRRHCRQGGVSERAISMWRCCSASL